MHHIHREGGERVENVSGTKTSVWINAATALGVTGMLAFAVYGYRHGIFQSRENMEAFLRPFGAGAPILFRLIQAIQAVIPIIPGGVSCLAGVILFGAGWGFVYNYLGICAGSFAAFLLARKYGRDLVCSITGKKAYEKYSHWLNGGKKFDVLFAAAIFFPFAPDDLLCYLAGLTKMTSRRFLAIILLGKPVSIALYSLGLWMFMTKLIPMF